MARNYRREKECVKQTVIHFCKSNDPPHSPPSSNSRCVTLCAHCITLLHMVRDCTKRGVEALTPGVTVFGDRTFTEIK